MLYREAGQFKTSYAKDQAVFPIIQDRWFIALVLVVAYGVVPFVANEYWLQAVLIPFLIFALAAIGLNLLTGYAGQLSLGTGAFMAVGAYATYKITTAFPEVNILVVFVMSGFVAAGVGVVFGIPSLRIKGFYLATGEVRYFIPLTFRVLFALAAKNLVRGRIGRSWMAIRDMDVAAEIIGIRPLRTKLLAFAISSFYCGVAGAMTVFLWLGSAETEAFDIFVSFQVLFMVIIGGLGSILGSILGAAFITLVPIFLTNAPALVNLPMPTDLGKHIEEIIFGGMIIFFLIVEPNGFARLWQIAKEKLRRWPFPY